MRIAVLGVGRMGQLHARLVAALDGVDEVLIQDVDGARAAELTLKGFPRPVAAFEVLGVRETAVTPARA